MPTKATTTDGELRVWWIPAPPAEPFTATVQSQEEGEALIDALADYNRYLISRGLMRDYDADAGGIEIFEDGEWVEVEDA